MTRFLPLSAAALATAVFAAPAAAEVSVSLPLQLGADGSITTLQYSCEDGTDLSVQYVNAGKNSLALIPLNGDEIIFVNVISASGARYVSGARTWWGKGNEATLSNDTSETGPLTCAVKGMDADQ